MSNATAQKKFRVVRGVPNPHSGKMFATGTNYTAADARDAVAQDEADTRKIFGEPGPFGIWQGAKPHPVIAVFEMVPVDPSDWR